MIRAFKQHVFSFNQLKCDFVWLSGYKSGSLICVDLFPFPLILLCLYCTNWFHWQNWPKVQLLWKHIDLNFEHFCLVVNGYNRQQTLVKSSQIVFIILVPWCSLYFWFCTFDRLVDPVNGLLLHAKRKYQSFHYSVNIEMFALH